jgi:hypothetical protein
MTFDTPSDESLAATKEEHNGYASVLGASSEIDGFADPIFLSQISSKKMADTGYSGPPFI